MGKRPLREVRAFLSQLVERFAPATPDGLVAGDVDWSDWPERFDRGGLLSLADAHRSLAQAMTYASWDDMAYVRALYGDDALRAVLADALAGVFDRRSWVYWHARLRIEPVPDLPARRL